MAGGDIKGIQIIIDIYVDELVAIGNHQLLVIINQRTCKQHGAGGPISNTIDANHIAVWRDSLKKITKAVILQVLILAYEDKTVRAGWRKVAAYNFNHRLAANIDQRFWKIITSF